MLTKSSRSNNMPNLVFKVDSLHEKLNQITKMYFSELQVIKTGSLLSVSEKEKDCPRFNDSSGQAPKYNLRYWEAVEERIIYNNGDREKHPKHETETRNG